MAITRKPFAVLAAAALAVSLAACGGDDDGGGDGTKDDGEAGGTLYYLTGPRLVEHWDPQRMYIGRDLSTPNRLFYRGLVTFPVTEDPVEGTTPVPDLATDTGTAIRRRQDLGVHAQGRREVGGRQAHHVRGPQVRRVPRTSRPT